MKNASYILMDISEQMENRQSMAQRVVLEKLLPAIDFNEIVGLKTFMASGDFPILIPSLDLEVNSKSDFEGKINSLPMPNQGAPIAAVIREAVEDLEKVEADNKRIVVVTAGIDTVEHNYLPAARNAAEKGVQISIVLINGDENALKMAEESAGAAGGVACTVNGDVDAAAPVAGFLKGNVVAKAAADVAKTVKSAVEDFSARVSSSLGEAKEALKEKATELKQTVGESIAAAKAENKEENVEPIAFKPLSVADFEPKQVKTEEKENVTTEALLKLVADNNAMVASVLKKNQECIGEIARQKAQAVEKYDAMLAEAIEKNNSSVAALLGNNVGALDQMAQQKAEALARVEVLEENERNVVIETNTALEEAIARKSQEYLAKHLQKKYPNRVKWLNEKQNAGLGYDFEVEETDNNSVEYYIACKGLIDNSATFYLTRKEWMACASNNRNYQVYLINNLEGEPVLTVVDNLMEWISNGRIVPCCGKNIKLKADSVVLTVVK